VIVAYRAKNRAVFLLGFAKNEQDNIDANQLTTARKVAESWLTAGTERITQAIEENELQEIKRD